MSLDRLLRERQIVGNLFIEEASAHEPRDIAFTCRQRVETLLQRSLLLAIGPDCRTPLARGRNCRSQSRIFNGLVQQIHCAELHRSDGGGDVRVS
jgi:hypothetical protein